ncbi:THAP domain-containing protein 3 isoform X1 [Alexandromys fortis]|uniref:THAP domain-containing protein 3 isoform X1 n=1 Tax=Alexandromys fortis TaxID=100897 RepID=UPI0021527DC4|nr:THAP domain-containing protein 3 isoform X1 [Microtus fortis]
MPKSCAARQCCNRYSSRRKQLTFHRTLFQCFYHGEIYTSVGSPQTTLHWHPLPVSSHLPTGRARFPFSRPELLKEWVLNIGRVNFKPKQHTVICSEHFRPECFSAFGNRKNLKHNAVPTVFAFQNPTQVCPEVGAGGDCTLEEFQPPDTEGPVKQVRPWVQAGLRNAPEDPTDDRTKASPKTTIGISQREVGEMGLELDQKGRGHCDPSSEAFLLGTQGHTWTALTIDLCPQVLPERTEAMEVSGPPAGPMGLERPFPGQPSDHSYALLDLDTLKKKLFLTLKENKRLRKRLRAQRLLLRRTCSRLRAYREGQRGPRARRPAQQN